MTGEQLRVLAAAQNVNSFYLGYALATGADCIEKARTRDGGNHGYMIWNEMMWNRQAKTESLSRDLVSIARGATARHEDFVAVYIVPSCPVPLP